MRYLIQVQVDRSGGSMELESEKQQKRKTSAILKIVPPGNFFCLI